MNRNYFDDLADRLAAVDGVGVEYGLDDSPHPSGMTAAQLGRVLYKGYEPAGIPARDFFADADRDVKNASTYYFVRFMHDLQGGRLSQRALDDLSAIAADALRSSIDNYTEIPNKPSTIRRKGFNKPLYHHGDLIDCVIAVVTQDAGADSDEAET